MNSLVRIKKEYKEITDKKDGSGIIVSLVNENFKHWKGTIPGPDGSPYQGGLFTVDIKIPDGYPFEPPKMKFDTKVWHPNISSQTGAICLDILKTEWSPALTMRTALLSLQALLSTPNPDDPQDAVVAGQYKSSIKEFEKKASEWTQQFAKPQDVSSIIKRMTDMGFSKEKCEAALQRFNNDETRAIDYLLTST